MARRRMSPEQAQALAEKYRARYPDLSPREIMEIVTDPSLEGFDPIVSPPREEYKGFRVPPGSPEQQQRYKRAIDDRLSGFDSRQVERDAAARAGLARDIRSNIAGVVKPASMAASVTPYDLGLGDVGYAAGELIDPEGTYGDAMLAAGGGLLTAGVGSGAIMSKAAKEARKGMKRADDVEDLTPTVMYDNPLNFPKRAGTPPSSARRSLEEVSKMSKAEQDAYLPALRKGVEYQAYANRYGSGGRFPEFRPDMKDIQSKITKQVDSMRTPPQLNPLAFGVGGTAAIGALVREKHGSGQEDVFAGARGMGYQDMVDEMAAKPIDPNLSVRMMNEVRKTTDYGNAFAETTDRQDPMNFSSADELADLPGLYQENRDAAVRIFEQTGSVPSGMARSLGKYEALMNTRGALLDEESRMLREGISFKPSMPIVEDRTMMAGQGGMGREIEPAMGDQPMDTMNEKKAYGE